MTDKIEMKLPTTFMDMDSDEMEYDGGFNFVKTVLIVAAVAAAVGVVCATGGIGTAFIGGVALNAIGDAMMGVAAVSLIGAGVAGFFGGELWAFEKVSGQNIDF